VTDNARSDSAASGPYGSATRPLAPTSPHSSKATMCRWTAGQSVSMNLGSGPVEGDAFGQALLARLEGRVGDIVAERDDGMIDRVTRLPKPGGRAQGNSDSIGALSLRRVRTDN
jgi:hypothetical protein